MAEFKVEMLAFQPDKVRTVVVPDEELAVSALSGGGLEEALELIYQYGQNDFQPVPGICSVSTGDVIHFNGERFKVSMVGFKKENPHVEGA